MAGDKIKGRLFKPIGEMTDADWERIESQPSTRHEFDPDEPHFDGDDYVHERDFNRLMPQLQKVKQYMEENNWVTLSELSNATGAPEASASAALRDLRKKKFGFRTVSRRYEGNGLYAYKLEEADYEEPKIADDWWKDL